MTAKCMSLAWATDVRISVYFPRRAQGLQSFVDRRGQTFFSCERLARDRQCMNNEVEEVAQVDHPRLKHEINIEFKLQGFAHTVRRRCA